MTLGQYPVHSWCSWMASSWTSRLLALKREISRSSCVNAFTTRTPGIASLSVAVMLDHFRQIRWKNFRILRVWW